MPAATFIYFACQWQKRIESKERQKKRLERPKRQEEEEEEETKGERPPKRGAQRDTT